MALESVKVVAVEWLDWAAKYAATQPQEFFTRRKLGHSILLCMPTFYVGMHTVYKETVYT